MNPRGSGAGEAGKAAEVVHPLDADALRVFAEKGTQGGADIPQQGNANAVKVRRIMQLTRDLGAKAFADLRILDLACGEGAYSIEAGLRGAEVVAIDGRTERMDQGAAIARRLGLTRVRFEQRDIREVTRETHGTFDVVYLLGILYHLEAPDVCRVLEHAHDLTTGVVLIDTHIALQADADVEHHGRHYAGSRHREHGDADTEAQRRAKVLMSLDNTFSFWYTRDALVRLLVDLGFTAVLEDHAPLEPGKPDHRITLTAIKGERAAVSAYPWINGLSEDAIAAALQPAPDRGATEPPASVNRPRSTTAIVNGVLRRTLGVEVRRA